MYALRHGELSILYPLIALGYVWVTITAVLAFHETMNPLKITGLVLIIGRRRGAGLWRGRQMKTPVSSMVLVLVGSVIGSIGAIFLKSGAHT